MNICSKVTIWVRNSQRDTSETIVGDHEPDHNEGMKKEVAVDGKAEHVYGHVRVFNTHAQVENSCSGRKGHVHLNSQGLADYPRPPHFVS